MAMFLSDLASRLGSDAVSTEPSVLDQYSVDSWSLALKRARRDERPNRPEAVVRVCSAAEVQTVLRAAGAEGVPVTPRGLGSSVTGQPLPSAAGIVLDLAGLGGAPQLDTENLTVTVPASTKGADLEHFLNARGVTLGHSPQSLHQSTVGGWVATRASGQFSSRYGGIEDLVAGLEAVLADGEIVRFKSVPRAATGPDLRQLFLGSEGILAVVTEVTLKVFWIPERRLVEAFRFARIDGGLQAMRVAMQAGLRPFLLRYYDQDESRHVSGDADFEGCLLFTGCEGVESLAAAEQQQLGNIAAESGGTSLGSALVDAWLPNRFDYSTVQKTLDTIGGYAETIEIAHNWSQIQDLYTTLKDELADHADHVFGHFSHAYPQGTSLYLILIGETGTDQQAVECLERIWKTAMTSTLRKGGELSHHHGAGLARLPYLADALPNSLRVLDSVKTALDPAGVLNPGKLIPGRSMPPTSPDNER